MFIKKVEIYGFKSFREREVFEFDSSITAIIGPNGCGKSNVVEAIKFALGEENLSNLRVKSLAELIFAGSKQKSMLSLAEVSLFILNHGRRISSDLTDIKLTRRVFRSGETQYFINDIPARLKDVHQLLAGTGIFKNAYSLIEQQTINTIINGYNNYLLFLLNEAAGITKYELAKEEILSKLNLTDKNSLRIQDLILHTQKQVENLYKQYKQYQEYKQLLQSKQEIEEELKRDAFLRLAESYKYLIEQENEFKKQKVSRENNVKRLQQQIIENKSHLYSLEVELEELLSTTKEIDNNILKLKDILLCNSYKLKEIVNNKGKCSELKNEIVSLETNINLYQDKIKLLKNDISSLLQEKKRIDDLLKKSNNLFKFSSLIKLIELKNQDLKQAIMNLLSDYKDAIITDNIEGAKELLMVLPEGVIIVKDLIGYSPNNIEKDDFKLVIMEEIGIKREEKEYKMILEKILDGVEVIAEDIDAYKQVSRFVTKDGIIYKDGIIIKKKGDERFISLSYKLSYINKELRDKDERIKELSLALVREKNLKTKYEERLKNILNQDNTEDETKLKEEINMYRKKLTEIEEKKKLQEISYYRLKKNIEELKTQLIYKENSLKKEKEVLRHIEDEIYKLSLKKNDLKNKIAEYGDRLDSLRDKKLRENELLQLKQRLQEVNHKISAYTENINPLSEKEYQKELKKFTFLTDQYKDIVLSKKRIKDALEYLEKQKDIIFNDAFSKINNNFSKVYKTIFGDEGQAKLLLLTKKDSDYKIEIFIKPPGKTPKNINLLSTGEKSLSAISLLFGIYLYKAAPFCIIDEADAGLDDINSEHFATLLKSLSKHSQFIIITHNKKTMEMSDTLYGVTMEEPGISKVVSVKLKRA